ncbi:MAG: MFS transporter [Pirellulaceae bacterium]|nr:MFS transporter [Pirellulaceae bacterium]
MALNQADQKNVGWEPVSGASRTRFAVLAFLCGAAVIAYLQRNCLGTAESTIRADLDLTKQEMGWLISSFFWAYAIFQIPTGWLSDRWGPRRALTTYATGWSLASVVMALAGTVFTSFILGWFGIAVSSVAWLWFIAARILGGAAQAGLFPSAASVLSGWMPRNRRAIGSGFIGGSQQIGGLLAAMLTAYLIDIADIHWRLILVIFAVPGFFWAAWFWRWFRNHPSEHSQVNAAELQLLGAAEKKQSSRPTATPWLILACSPATWCICGQQFCRGFGYIFYSTWFPTYLQETHGVSIAESGFLSALPLMFVLVAAPLGGTISDSLLDKTGSHRIARSFFGAICLGGCAMFIFIAYFVSHPTLAVLVISAGSFCAGLIGPVAYATTIDMAGKHVATVFGTMNMSGNIGAAIFPLVVPVLLRVGGMGGEENWDLVLFAFAGVYAIGAFFWLFLNPRGTMVEHSLRRVYS